MSKRVIVVARELRSFNRYRNCSTILKVNLRLHLHFAKFSSVPRLVNDWGHGLSFNPSRCTSYSTPQRTFSFLLANKMGKELVFNSSDFRSTTLKRVVSSHAKPKSHYEVLNVSKNASSEEIRQAFLSLSKAWHPDRNTNDPSRHQKFVQINEAYTTLSKPHSRRDYDLSLDAERYVSRQMSAASSSSHTYGYSPHSAPYYHYRDHVYDETYWSGEAHSVHGGKLHTLFNFYMLIACATLAAVSIIMHYMYRYIPNPKHNHLRKDLTPEEMEQHTFIMQSEQDGATAYYYAIPKDSGKFDIVVLKKAQCDDTGKPKMHEVTRSAK
ncbi:chaperone protein Dnaj [Plakobranchus ocellatus]|uniref:Chaperone protein Dnaj n=1 Tax=Plakobranchus ocellatus TaxID=259542 RepID=A0AAV3ZWZ7_9GAST|nr:chaperone protein Dnaj [Plakobranchus ocellatus]